MKNSMIALLLVLIAAGCDSEKYGNVRQQLKCTTAEASISTKSLKTTHALQYTQFGSLITTLTPTSFIGEMEAVRYYAENEYGSFMTLVHREVNSGESAIEANFSNNATIPVTPTLNGSNIMLNSDGIGGFFKDNVTFKSLWIRMGLKQTIELPAAYNNVRLDQFQRGEKSQNIITTDVIPLFQVVDNLKPFGQSFTIFFGCTDSTYMEYKNTYLGHATLPYIRSSKYKEWTLTPPQPNVTKNILSTIGFNNTNIIQVYSGKDNLPYTSDDIVVLEPKFWERIYVNVSEN